MHGGVHAPGERILPWEAQFLLVAAFQVQRSVQPLDRFAGSRDEFGLALWSGFEGLTQSCLFPMFLRLNQFVGLFAHCHLSNPDVNLSVGVLIAQLSLKGLLSCRSLSGLLGVSIAASHHLPAQ